MHAFILTALSASAVIISTWLVRKWRRRSNLPLPPAAPNWLPLLGHVRSVPPTEQWKAYHQWAKERNTDILYLNLVGQDVVVLDTLEAATELMEKRSAIYSGRIRQPMLELVGWGSSPAFIDYGPRWRQHLRLIHGAFQPSGIKEFHPHFLRTTHMLLQEILDNPEEDIVTSVGRMAGRSTLSIIYGIKSRSRADMYTEFGVEGVRVVSAPALPGVFWIDFFPFLKYVPEWMPGAAFQELAAHSHKVIYKMIDEPFIEMKKAMEEGVCEPCFCSSVLEAKGDDEGVDDRLVRDVAGGLVGAASETTVAVISSCILGLLQNPSNIQRAQAELDKVIPAGQLPSFEHEPELPFITALVYEGLRWRDIVPLGIPHKLMQDDVYKGYHIPKGTAVIPNMWAMLHDEDAYPDPFPFNPSRFMKGDVLDATVRNPSTACWGFGRRICSGRHSAFATMWIALASIIYCFNIEKARDENGEPIEPLDEMSIGLACVPKPYKSCLTPRSEAIAALIRKSVDQDE